jgi:hypothetical protein
MTTIPPAKQEAAKIVFEFETRVQSGEFGEPDGHQASVALEHMIEQALLAAEKRGREEAAKIVEQMPDQMLHFWDRPGGPPGNGYRPTTRADIAAAIRSTN